MRDRKVFDFVVVWVSWALVAILFSNNSLSFFSAFFFSFITLVSLVWMFTYLAYPHDAEIPYPKGCEPNVKEDLFAMGKVFVALYCVLTFAMVAGTAFGTLGIATLFYFSEIEMPVEGVGYTRDEIRMTFLLPILFIPTIMTLHNYLTYGKLSLFVLPEKKRTKTA